MPEAKKPSAPPPPAKAKDAPDEDTKRPDSPAKLEQKGVQAAKGLKEGQMVRVCLTHGYPLWCHTQQIRLMPGEEPKMVVDQWVKANIERGNLDIVN